MRVVINVIWCQINIVIVDLILCTKKETRDVDWGVGIGTKSNIDDHDLVK